MAPTERPEDAGLYRFGPFTLDTRRRVLARDGVAIALTPKALDILVALIEHHGEVLDKDQLMDRVWPGQAVEEGNLTVNVSALRKALGERPGEHRYVVTIPGRGYTFVDTVSAPANPAARPTFNLRRATVLASAVLVTTVGAWMTTPPMRAGEEAIRSIAVLPFTSLTESGRDEALELGLADVVSTRLATIRELIVSPSSSARRYAGRERDPIAAGRELQVESVVDGTIHHAGSRLRITLRLLLVRDGSSRWAERIEAPVGDLFNIEEAIAQGIARALKGELTADETRQLTARDTHHAEAHREYLIGRLHWNRMNRDGWTKSAESFQRAATLDSNYARAHAGLADAYVALASDAPPSSGEAARGRHAAVRGVQLDPSLAEAHVALGRVQAYFDWDWKAAERSFRRAIELAPHFADAHREYGLYLATQGRTDESIAATKRALELDPISLFNNFAVGWSLIGARQYDRTIEHFQRALDIDSQFVAAHHFIGLGYLGKGMYREATVELERARALAGENLLVQANLGFAYAQAGDSKQAERILADFDRLAAARYVSPYYLATVNAGLGRTNDAFAYLQQAYDDRSRRLWALKVAPQWEALRSDRRFSDMLHRMRLD